MEYKIIKGIPSIDDYMILRELTLGKKTREQAEKVINSFYCIYVVYNEETIAMGRMLGDGALTYLITDIMVKPEHQKKGIGKLIMKELVDYYKDTAPKNAYLTLMAEGDAKYLYQKFGFEELTNTVGMVFNNKLL